MKYIDLDFNDKTILITGGAGFIGSNLVNYFQENYPDSHIVVFDCLRSEETFSNGNLKSFGHFNNLIGFNGDLICGNLNNLNDLNLLNKYKFDFIFHQAAISDTRVLDQEIVIQTNLNSFHYFLETAKKTKATLVYASSASTYGDLPSPQKIGLERPDNAYGFSKFMMDKTAQRYIKNHPEMKIVGLRYFNVYGHNEFFKNKTSSMVIQLALQILSGQKPKLFENSDQYFRDFVFIEDVIQANIKACNSRKNGVFNVGTGIPKSFQDIVDTLQKILVTNLDIEYFPNPFNNYQVHTQADITESKKYLDYAPLHTLEDGINKYISEIRLIHQNLR